MLFGADSCFQLARSVLRSVNLPHGCVLGGIKEIALLTREKGGSPHSGNEEKFIMS